MMAEKHSESPTKTYVFIGLVALEIAFIAFIFITRYVTRNHHHHDEDEEEEL
ncbi:MAG: hypothetical protein AAF617_02410 [Bacteroidota bacterium]